MERFRFENGREMSPFWVYRTLNDDEKHICWNLVVEGGPLGLDEEDIAEAQIELYKVDALVECGIVKKAPLFQMAKDLVNDEKLGKRMARLEEEGGFLAATNEDDKLFISSFDMACEIVQSGDVEGNSTMHYQVAKRDLYDFLGILF